eukprot:TRINITY_DN6086_c0_g1_i1.p1 TRINITY_DN6086_c0_g1~~TRINITY_DN6086_c0_g1_i1.p1  ORF type:complete len:556 (+),score=112.68 TRINITY_DN6086_c0_g1_i1:77-1669(+)
MKRTVAKLLAESPEDVYRLPTRKRSFVQMLPLPRYSDKQPLSRSGMSRFKYLKHMVSPPKPRWYSGLSQTSLYSSVLKYTENQLSDEKLFKLEDYSSVRPELGEKRPLDLKGRIERAERALVQPSFRELEPDDDFHNKRSSDVDQAVWNMLEELKKSPPSLLPHPGLAAYGEALTKTFIVEYATDLFPRLHSRHLDDLLSSKMNLSAIVSTGSRIGLCRGLAMEREAKLYYSAVSMAAEKLKYKSIIAMRRKNITNGSMTDDIITPMTLLQRLNYRFDRLRLSDEQFDLLEERMKLLARHVYAFIAYSSILNGEDFTKAFVMRYCMPDVLKQEISKNEDMKDWLKINCKWKFTDTNLVPKDESDYQHDMGDVEPHTGVVAAAIRKMLVTPNPIKELQLVVSNDITTRGFLDSQPLEYKVLYENFEDVESPDNVDPERGVRMFRVGVYAGNLLLGEGSGRTYDDAARSAAQTVLYSYYMNPLKNYLPPRKSESTTTAKGKKKKKKKKEKKNNKKAEQTDNKSTEEKVESES